MPVPKNRKTVIKKSLRALGCDEDRLRILDPEIEHAVWLEQKIDQARELIASTPIVEEYQNGPNQSGTRKSPAYEALHKMVSSYNSCIKVIVDAVAPVPVKAEVEVSSSQDTARKRDIMMALRQAEEERGTNGK